MDFPDPNIISSACSTIEKIDDRATIYIFVIKSTILNFLVKLDYYLLTICYPQQWYQSCLMESSIGCMWIHLCYHRSVTMDTRWIWWNYYRWRFEEITYKTQMYSYELIYHDYWWGLLEAEQVDVITWLMVVE